MPGSRRLAAFTLIEALVALVVIALLAAIAGVGYTSVIGRAHDTKAQVHLRQLATGVLAGAVADQDGAIFLRHVQTAVADFPTVQAASDPGLSGSRGGVRLAAGWGWDLLAHDQVNKRVVRLPGS